MSLLFLAQVPLGFECVDGIGSVVVVDMFGGLVRSLSNRLDVVWYVFLCSLVGGFLKGDKSLFFLRVFGSSNLSWFCRRF